MQKLTLSVQHPTEPEPAPPMTPERKKLAQMEFVNFDAVLEYFPLKPFYLADYLIIYPNSDYEDEVEPLANQKRARGYRVTEMLVSDIGNTCNQIRSAIQAWEATRPSWRDTYALLIGDTDSIPLCTSHAATLALEPLMGAIRFPEQIRDDSSLSSSLSGACFNDTS